MSDSLLRRSIRWDATGVGLLGVGVLAFAGPLARFSGLTPAQCYITGASFLLYGMVGNLWARRDKVRGIGIGLSAFNFTGTLGAVALAVTDLLPLTNAGRGIVLACGVYTLVFGFMQAIGVHRMPAGLVPTSLMGVGGRL